MKTSLLSLLALSLLGLSGCGSVDLTPEGEGNPARILMGTLELAGSASLPADTVVIVRVVDPSRASMPSPTAVLGTVSTPAPEMSQPPAVLGEQTIRGSASQPIAFRVEYAATDDQLRRGLNVEARVAFGGRVRYSNLRGYGITISNFTDPMHVMLENVAQ